MPSSRHVESDVERRHGHTSVRREQSDGEVEGGLVRQHRKGRGQGPGQGPGSAGGAGQGKKRAGRRGMEVALDHPAPSLLSPLLSQFSSIGISSMSLRDYLPSSTSIKALPPPEIPHRPSTSSGKSSWQMGDLGDGQGKRPLLLITSRHHALQIFTIASSAIPIDPHVAEAFPAPEEVFSLSVVRFNSETVRSSLQGVTSRVEPRGEESVVAARLLDRYDRDASPLVALILSGQAIRSGLTPLALVLVDLATGMAVRRLELGMGKAADIASSPKALVVALSHPSPTLHLLHPHSLEPLHPSITYLPPNPHTSLPVFALLGRILAHSTSVAAHHPGPDGLGSIVTARSLQQRVPQRRPSHLGRDRAVSAANPPQGALLTSAVEIGGGVARGVWAGLKMGAKAAGRARNGRLARSAPSEGSVLLDEELDEGGSESRSLDNSSLLSGDGTVPDSGHDQLPVEGEWIQVIDLLPRKRTSRRTAGHAIRAEDQASEPVGPEVIAHFRLPNSRPFNPLPPDLVSRPRSSSNSAMAPVGHLAFSPDGTKLFAAPADGRVFHILDIHPAGLDAAGMQGEVRGEVWHQYELRRGNTAATVSEVQWSADGRWVGVATGKGTVHVYAVNPFGGPPSSASHLPIRLVNLTKRYPLSTIISPCARLRRKTPHHQPNQALEGGLQSGGATFTFLTMQSHPQSTSTSCLDLAIYRSPTAHIELARLSIRAVSRNSTLEKERSQVPSPANRVSGLTEMMKDVGRGDSSELGAEGGVKARWTMPLGSAQGEGELLLQITPIAKTASPLVRMHLARAEIQTFSHHPAILPPSIYLSHQFDFFSARPIDDYSPLSILDPEARTGKLTFRPEVQVRSASSYSLSPSHSGTKSSSFDEPLLSALHSVIDSTPTHQLPGLPNGPLGRSWRHAIPIGSVTAGLGEGVDRVRREYARAQVQVMRSRERQRRKSEAARMGYGHGQSQGQSQAGNALSFEEDTVFASAMEGEIDGESSVVPLDIGAEREGGGQGGGRSSSTSRSISNSASTSSPSSGLPTTNTDDTDLDELGLGDGDGDGLNGNAEDEEAEWGDRDRWEEEYRLAVEDDGGPDDLVLGLMDEEREERRKWEMMKGMRS